MVYSNFCWGLLMIAFLGGSGILCLLPHKDFFVSPLALWVRFLIRPPSGTECELSSRFLMCHILGWVFCVCHECAIAPFRWHCTCLEDQRGLVPEPITPSKISLLDRPFTSWRVRHASGVTTAGSLYTQFQRIWTDSKQEEELGTAPYSRIHRNAFQKGKAITLNFVEIKIVKTP